MAVNLSPVGGVAAQFFTNNAVPLSGGKLYTYAAGTTTPQVAYTTSQGNITWTNPIVLDAGGRVPGSGEIWLTDGLIYKFVLKDANDVLIATYDNITGINSNAVAYTNSQEIQTATAGQTVFTLTTMQYQVATNSLSVFVDGVNQYGPGAQYAYVETDSTTVTFASGLHVGAEVKFTTTQQQGAGAVDAEQVSYTPPFAGSVTTNVEAKLAQTVSAKDFGAVGDGITDDTAALQAALDAIFAQSGGTLYIPTGDYLITADLEPQISLSPLNRNFRIIGDGMESTNIVGAGFGLKIYADTPPARNNAFTSLLLQNFSMVGSGLTGIGIDIYSMQRSVISGVSCRGYDYGLRLRSSWNNSINDRCQFQENNVGIKVPVVGSGSTLNEGFNNIDISGVSCSNNAKAGISLAAGNVISIRDVLLESCPVGVYLLEALQWVYLNNLYYETGSVALTRNSRSGVPTSYLVYTGSDEDLTVGNAAFPVKNLVINNAMEYFGEGKIWLDNVLNVNIPNSAISDNTLCNVTDRVSFVRGRGIQGDNRFSTLLQDGKTASTANGVFKTYPYNFISNGNMAYPGLPPLRNQVGTASAARTTQSVNGTTSSVMAVTLPIGETTNTFFFTAYLGNEFGTNGAELTASMRCKASTADVASVAIELRNSGGATLTGTAATKASGVTNWFSLNASGNPVQFGATSGVLFVVTVTRTTAAAADTLYIDELVLLPRESDGLSTMGAQDLDCGLTGTVTPTTAAGGWFYETVNPGLQQSTSFRVVATPRFDGTYSAAEVQVQYLGGGDDGKFNIWCSRTGVTIDYHIYRLQHLAP